MTGPRHSDPVIETPEQRAALDPEALEVAPGVVHERLEGWMPGLATEDEIRVALDKAFDYRGDVTITRKDGVTLDGYIFDRHAGATLQDSFVRVYPKDSNERICIRYVDIASLSFSGRDTAAGKSFDAWIKKYWEKRAAGEKGIGIEAEKLE